jgi:hypothetical protein
MYIKHMDGEKIELYGDVLSTHLKTTPNHKPSLELAKFSSFVSLCVEAFKFGFHVFMCEGDA